MPSAPDASEGTKQASGVEASLGRESAVRPVAGYNLLGVSPKDALQKQSTKKYLHYDFSKTLPRAPFARLARRDRNKGNIAYAPNFSAIEKKKDKLCIPFGKTIGRADVALRAAQPPSLGAQMMALTKKLKSHSSSNPKRRGSGDPAARATPRTRVLVSMAKSLPRETDPGSKFPAWMQKRGVAHRLAVDVIRQKSCEMNGYEQGRMREHQDFLDRRNLRSERARFKLQLPADSQEELEDLPSEDYID